MLGGPGQCEDLAQHLASAAGGDLRSVTTRLIKPRVVSETGLGIILNTHKDLYEFMNKAYGRMETIKEKAELYLYLRIPQQWVGVGVARRKVGLRECKRSQQVLSGCRPCASSCRLTLLGALPILAAQPGHRALAPSACPYLACPPGVQGQWARMVGPDPLSSWPVPGTHSSSPAAGQKSGGGK